MLTTFAAHPSSLTEDSAQIRYATHLKSWDELAAIIASGDYTDLNRTREGQEEYDQAKVHYDQHHGGIAQYVMKNRLHWTLEGVLETQQRVRKSLAAVIPSPANDSLAPTVVSQPAGAPSSWPFDPALTQVLSNDYPYALDKAITHQVLWSQLPLDPNDPRVHAYLTHRFADCDVLFMVHNPALQSVRAIPHGHVFTRPKVAA
ncbi:hypothetical protein IWQ60_007428 [Tieghemiomyces parasiticus]|uniref:Uncharacterized protein n=1 Tax=Tieghemiomyces parasiticus TaxID=78921 RepID=A0A9W8A2J7_9FUNG|nr:hypothetical protein IWQ60_007428 [Tieghemiomyces parasiticus]